MSFVAIKGGGIAGQVLQRELTLKGISSRLEERCLFPRDKVCGGVLQWDSWEYLNSIFTIRVPVRKIRVLSHFWGKKKISSLRLSREMVYVPRLVLDDVLNSQNQPVVPGGHEKVIEITASGAEDFAGEWIGFQTQHRPVDEMQMYYGQDAYLGVTPTLEETSHAALIVRKSSFKSLDDLKEKVCRETGIRLEMPLKGTARIRYGYSSVDLAVGDAKLTTHPFLGLGMKHAILSARLLATMIAENQEIDYDKIHRKIFKKFHGASLAIHRLTASPFRLLCLPFLKSTALVRSAYEWLHS
jgi:flavin-dependent dehydrogenase